ncbi:MAG: hypothetical protein GTO60_04325, partial [Gammaproteobacteria bacterium]|nr:hypothetical protein [Gammaproteobacteria bacterium]NIO63664.1 hypothetical protein [Gammaproteobacteria bacterium]
MTDREKSTLHSCPVCASAWIDRASRASGFILTGLEQQQLLAALLARRHIILSGPMGIGKTQLAQALAASMTGDYHRQTMTIQGHPWWTIKTGDPARFVKMQVQFSTLRLNYFVEDILQNQALWSDTHTRRSFGDDVISIHNMSPFEIDLYFKGSLPWLTKDAREFPLRLIGTYDS